MLGRLLHTAASSLNPVSYTSRHQSALESVTEEEHTRSLLFPDSSLLQHTQGHTYPFSSPPTSTSTSGFDDHGGLELDVGKDFRIIIAQDANGGQDSCVLFDSQSSKSTLDGHGLGLDSRAFEVPRGAHSRNPSGSKVFKSPVPVLTSPGVINGSPNPVLSGSSIGSTRSGQRPFSPAPTGAFCRSKLRSSTLSSIPSEGESNQSRLDRDAKEETTALLNCMFGSTIITYKGPSTKMHILSLDTGSAAQSTVNSPIIGRDMDAFPAGELRKRAPLSRANTMSPILGDARMFSAGEPKGLTKGTVLLTRTFAVQLPEECQNTDDSHLQDGRGSLRNSVSNGFPFPDVSDPQSGSKPRKNKTRKTPIYAVAVILQLPVSPKNFSRPPSRHQPASFAKPGLSIPSSFDSQKSDWTFLDSPSGIFSPALATPGSLDERIDVLVDHWDVMTRTLSNLEKFAREEIFNLLMREDALSPAPQPAKREGMQKTNQRFVRLPPNTLFDVKALRRETEHAVQRISLALRIPRVIAGQDRWGIWREEARWVGRWAGGREQNFFFFNLLTAFLGNHTEWLSSLGPPSYKRRHFLQQKAHQDAEPAIPRRTVIVATDKMAARRLIFLLSAFLPSTHRIEVVGSPMRPGTSMSRRGYSPSPTNSLAREESLRRTMNRQRLDQRRNMNLDASRWHERSTSLSSVDGPTGEAMDKLDSLERVSTAQSQRDSDVRSIRTASLPIPTNDISTRKSSAATTLTATPNRTTPVAHFAPTNIRPTLHNGHRSDSNDSVASANLLQTLRRSESTNMSSDSTDSHSGSRWGSLLSNIWSSKQDSSTDGSDFTVPSGTRSAKSTAQSPQYTMASRRSQSKLEDMTEEVAKPQSPQEEAEGSEQSNTIVVPKGSAQHLHEKTISESPEVHFLPDEPPKRDRPPIKLQVDENDGVVDVEIPLPNFFSSSIESALNSPSKDFRQSVASLDGLASIHSHASAIANPQRDHIDGNVNVAGWLQTYHDDFALQAVLPYQQLESDIKRAMSGEPTPTIISGTPVNEDGYPQERWTNVCSTLIADANNFSIKRIRMKRKIKVGHLQPSLPSDADFQPSSMNESQLGSLLAASTPKQAPSDIIVKEEFFEDKIMDLDLTVTDTVERMLARSGQSSKVQSRATSPSGRGRGGPVEQRDQSGDILTSENAIGLTPAEIPRAECRKMVLGALEQVVRSVTAEKQREEAHKVGDKEDRTSRPGSIHRSPDNTLREGIRKWLEEVEEAG
jgi:hypothetical protein